MRNKSSKHFLLFAFSYFYKQSFSAVVTIKNLNKPFCSNYCYFKKVTVITVVAYELVFIWKFYPKFNNEYFPEYLVFYFTYNIKKL